MHTCSGSLHEVVNNSHTAKANIVYTFALTALTDTKTSSCDNWGNVRVPWFEMLTRPNASRDNGSDDGWISVHNQVKRPEHYSSLIGNPLAGVPSAPSGNAVNFLLEFSLQSSYFSLVLSNCTPWTKYHWGFGGWRKYFGQVWGNNVLEPNPYRPFYKYLNNNYINLEDDKYWVQQTNFFLDTTTPFMPVMGGN
jgi:hypothetical protein